MLRPDKKYSVYDLRQLKGKRCLTHVHVKSPDEAAAAEAAGIDLLSCSFDTPASQARLPLLVAAASPAGAAWTEFAATAPVMAVAERVTPLLVKNSRSFSIARFIRIRAASSVVPIAAPICLNSLRSKNRSTTASCSFPKTIQCLIQMRCQLPPNVRIRFVQNGLHVCLLFAELATALNFECVGGSISCRAAEPTGEDCLWTQRFCFACQDDENGLGDFLSQMRVADLSQSD